MYKVKVQVEEEGSGGWGFKKKILHASQTQRKLSEHLHHNIGYIIIMQKHNPLRSNGEGATFTVNTES